MKQLLLLLTLSITIGWQTPARAAKGNKHPATVIITAGQSNTDGRVMNTDLPDYIQANQYTYCHWCYGSAGQAITGRFETFRPRIVHKERPDRWAYDAVTYYWLEQALQEDFYVVKWSLGGTAIDTTATSTSRKYWNANPEWLSRNRSTATGGKSLLLSLTENIAAAIDNTLGNLAQGYRVKAFLWHQGESDYRHGSHYYENLKGVVGYVRQFLVEKTGDKSYHYLPFICGTVSRHNKNYSPEVEAAMYQLAKEDKNFYVIDMSDAELQRDKLHFTARSAEQLGIEMYNQLVELGVAGKKARKVTDIDKVSVSIAPYKDNKDCAISYTFDDGLKEHYTLVAPELEKRDFRGTFWINGKRINKDQHSITDTTRTTWPELKTMADNGHEISNHGWGHKNFGRFSFDEIKRDVFMNDSAIFEHTGIMPLTFCYPNNKKTPEGVELVSKNRVATRTFQRSIGGKATPENLEAWVNQLIDKKDWGVGMTHGITYGYDAFKNPLYFWQHLDRVKQMEDRIWVGTFVEVARYIKQRDNIQLKIKKKKNKLLITPTLSLDKKLFNAPLTMIVHNADQKELVVMQGKQTLPVRYSGSKAMFDFDPWGGGISILF